MPTSYPPKFEQFWKVYPRKVAKVNAAKAWEKQGVEDDMYMAQAAIDDIEKRTRLKWWSTDPSKIPHPASWINAQRWYDEGWEDDIGKDPKKPPVTAMPKPLPDEPEIAWQQRLFARLFRAYCLSSGGLPETVGAVKIKNQMMLVDVPAIDEDVVAKNMTVNQAALQLARLFLDRLDAHYGIKLADNILRDN